MLIFSVLYSAWVVGIFVAVVLFMRLTGVDRVKPIEMIANDETG